MSSHHQPERARRENYRDIQVLRAFAAALVVLSHGLIIFHPHADRGFAGYIGYLGVCIFFVISGFIMAATTFDLGGAADASMFMRKRLIRIVPVYWLSTALLAAVMLRNPNANAPFDTSKFFQSLLFVPSTDGPDGPVRPFHNQGWTLELEMMFYLIFCASIWLVPRRKIAGAVLGIAVLAVLGSAWKSPFDTSYPKTLLTFFTDPVILLFAAGCCLAKARWQTATTSVALRWATTFGLVAATLVSFRASSGSFPFPFASLCAAWAVAIGCVWLCRQAFVDERSGFVMRLLIRCGDASYSAYMFHIFFVTLLVDVWKAAFGEAFVLPFLAIALTASFAIAWLLYDTVEKPLTALLRGAVLPTSKAGRRDIPDDRAASAQRVLYNG